jgi:hypothetical protein
VRPRRRGKTQSHRAGGGAGAAPARRVWEQLFPAERQRIVQLLIERVTLRDEGIEIAWREVGWATLVGEMLPGTIGAELAEFEQIAGGLA